MRASGHSASPGVQDPHDPAAVISVSHIAGAIDLLSEGTALFVNRQTGEVTVRCTCARLPWPVNATIFVCGNAVRSPAATEAKLDDGELQQLCRSIVEGQQQEIAQMKTKLRALDR